MNTAKRILVTGGAGFIGSHFCDQALMRGHQVLAFDDLSTGRREFLSEALNSKSFHLEQGDIRDLAALQKTCVAFKPEIIAHFAANADVRQGLERPRRDLDYNTIGTWNVAESARVSQCKEILFSSTGSVYGEPEVFPTPEDAPFPVQTSLYAASKLAGEGILSAYAIGFGINVSVFRFVSILGPRYSHGHVYDFIQKLRQDSSRLKVLGNGRQLKSYLHVTDLMNGLWMVLDQSKANRFSLYNIGHDDSMTVERSLSYIVDEINLKPIIEYGESARGWVGDSPRIQLSTSRLKTLGWKAESSLEASVRETARYLLGNPWLFKKAENH